MKCSTPALFRNRIYRPMVVFYDFFDERKADTAALVIHRLPQALKDDKYLLLVFRAETDAVVADDNFTMVYFWVERWLFFNTLFWEGPRSYLHYRRNALGRKFERIADKVGEQLVHLKGYGLYFR